MPTSSDAKRGVQEDLERYRTHSRPEIERVLADLARTTQSATLFFNGGKEFIVSAVVAYDGDSGALYLDYGPDESKNRRLLAAPKAALVSRHKEVRVQFALDAFEKAQREGHPAFRTPTPPSMIRLQRREFYRLQPPLTAPLLCCFATDGGHNIEAVVADISAGGIGLWLPRDLPAQVLPAGTVVERCYIELPEGLGTIESGFEVRNVIPRPNGPGDPQLRVGCRFIDLHPRQTARLQRYIHKVELERRRVARDG